MFKWLKDFFIPHRGNGYAPSSLEKVAMIGMLFLVVLSFTATNILTIIWPSSEWMVSTILPAVVVDLTNEERDSKSLGTLVRNPVLDSAAKMKAQGMVKNEYFAHYSPTGVSPWHWFTEASYNFANAGENLAIHFSDSDDVVDAWMKSPTHRANIMNGAYTEIGVGTAEGMYKGSRTVFVVQLFGTPAEQSHVNPIATKPVTPTEVASNPDTSVLSESVSVEQIPSSETKESEVANTQDTEPQTPVATETQNNVETKTVPIPVMDTSEDGHPLYSDFISTTTNAIPARIEPTDSQSENQVPFFPRLATQPHTVLQILYIVIGLFVFISLLLSIFIEMRHQQPIQVAYGVGLLALMFVLFYIHNALSTGALIT